MTRASEIADVLRQTVKDSEARDFCLVWLSTFYSAGNYIATINAQSRVFCQFSGNEFYRKHIHFLEPLCANAIMAWAEGVEVIQGNKEDGAGFVALANVLEPVIHAVRLTNGNPSQARSYFMALLQRFQVEAAE